MAAADPLSEIDPSLARYDRQMRFAPIGEAGQRRLRLSRVVLVGCGALGSVAAELLARAGVGAIRIIDRDYVELSNLQRQVLFDEHDIAANLPKAPAAARKLARINSAIEIEPVVSDLNAANAEALCEHADLILDGTDNFETRFLINDVAIKAGVPWVYGACVAAEGLVLPILPGQTPCFRCVWSDAPPPGASPTCDTAGVVGPVVGVVASLQVMEAIKILTGSLDAVCRRLAAIDVWSSRVRYVDVGDAATQAECPCCARREFEYLSGARGGATTTLCGRNAVQVLPAAGARVDFKRIAAGLPAGFRPVHNEFLMRFTAGGQTVTLFGDGRAIVSGTNDAAAARTIYAKFVGA